MIKAVGIEQVLLEMRSLIKEAAGRYSTDGILQILKCLQNNREYLSYYPDEFACCAYSAGLSVPFKPVIECEQVDDVQKNTKYYYPYSPYAKISWCLDKNKYAVYKDTSIFICELENQSEICAIHTDIAANNSRVINVDWLSTDKLLVVLSTNVILIYSISNDRSILWKRFECSSSCVKCDTEMGVIYYHRDDNLIAVDINRMETTCCIKVEKKGKVDFDVDTERKEIIILSDANTISVFSSMNGALVKKVRFHFRHWYHNYMTFRFLGGRLIQLSEHMWIKTVNEVEDFEEFYEVLNENGKKVSYLLPPLLEYPSRSLLGRKTILVIRSGAIIAINPMNRLQKFFPVSNVQNISWVEIDISISVLTDTELAIIKLADFSCFEDPDSCCMEEKRNLLYSPFLSGKKLFSTLGPIIRALHIAGNAMEIFDYRYFFHPMFERFAEGRKIWVRNDDDYKLERVATAVWISDNGITVVAYEKADAIGVFDSMNKPIFYLDKLNLSILDSLLDVKFSPDENRILIRRNYSLQVFSIQKRTRIANINVTKRPVADAWFSDNSQKLEVIYRDGSKYSYSLERTMLHRDTNVPKPFLENIDIEVDIGPYIVYDSRGELRTDFLIDGRQMEIEGSIETGIRKRHTYIAEDNLIFEGGCFSLDNGVSFSAGNINFAKCLQNENAKRMTNFDIFLQEKHDMFSSLYETNSGRFFILISKLLNSVIVFDKTNMCVVAAYKCKTKIIGDRVLDGSTIEIWSVGYPYRTKIGFNLP